MVYTPRNKNKIEAIPWHEQLRRELAMRDDKCRSYYGPFNEYVRPLDAQNVYRNYKTLHDFKKTYPFDAKHRQKHCKLMDMKPLGKLDTHGRYYTIPKTKQQCDNIGGWWDQNAIHRGNKYDRGVCWKSNPDKICGSKAVTEALRPFEVRNNPHVKQKLHDIKQHCEKEKGCAFVQPSKYSYDCFFDKRKTQDFKEIGPVFNPPTNMPTRNTDQMETFLYDWYVGKKHGDPPKVGELMGTGNRCRPTSSQAKDATVKRLLSAKARLPARDLTILDPTNKDDIAILVKYGVPPENIQEWQRRKQIEINGRYTFKDDFLIDKIQAYAFDLADLDDHDQDVVLREMENVFEMKPSIPQSVVNMVMKNIALHPENTNRGMLAWHSLGSGKTCTAAGVMDAFWDTDKQIIFASSLDAIASNPDYKFHECAMNLFPRFSTEPFTGKTKEESLSKIAHAFQQRGIRFLSFAKLANRVMKTEAWKKQQYGGATRKSRQINEKPTRKSRQTNVEPIKPTRKSRQTNVEPIKPTRKSRQTNEKPDKITRKSRQTSVEPIKPTRKSRQTNVEPIKPTRKSRQTNEKLVKPTRKSRQTNEKLDKPTRKSRQTNENHAKHSGISNDDYVDLDNAILIIDEVHNLFRPLATQRAQHEYLEKHLIQPSTHPNLKIVILTATPGDNIPDVIKLLNLVRDPTQPSITPPDPTNIQDIQRFKESIRGMISFFDMSSDDTKFPTVVDEQQPIKYPMTNTQLQKYIEAYKEVKADSKDFDTLAKKNQTQKYWKQARKYANTLFNFEKHMTLPEFSAKLPHLLKNITDTPTQKHYVYSSFYENRGYGGQGIIAIAKELDKLGYEKFTVAQAKSFNASSTLPLPKKRYILAINNEIGEEGTSTAGKNLHQMIRIFNNSQNAQGQLVHVFLASQGFNEGLDLKAVRHVHFFEPLVTMASDRQTVGRAARYCSHADLNRDAGEWTVQVHRYISDFPQTNNLTTQSDGVFALEQQILQFQNQLAQFGRKASKEKTDLQEQLKGLKKILSDRKKSTHHVKKFNTDAIQNIEQVIFDESRERMKLLLTVYQAMKEVALDCRMLQAFHSSTGNTIQCAF